MNVQYVDLWQSVDAFQAPLDLADRLRWSAIRSSEHASQCSSARLLVEDRSMFCLSLMTELATED